MRFNGATLGCWPTIIKYEGTAYLFCAIIHVLLEKPGEGWGCLDQKRLKQKR